MTTLRTQLIRLAYEKPDLRPHLLPLITKVSSDGKFEDYVKGKKFKNPETGNDVSFSSLPSPVQKEIRKDWNKSKSKEESSSSKPKGGGVKKSFSVFKKKIKGKFFKSLEKSSDKILSTLHAPINAMEALGEFVREPGKSKDANFERGLMAVVSVGSMVGLIGGSIWAGTAGMEVAQSLSQTLELSTASAGTSALTATVWLKSVGMGAGLGATGGLLGTAAGISGFAKMAGFSADKLQNLSKWARQKSEGSSKESGMQVKSSKGIPDNVKEELLSYLLDIDEEQLKFLSKFVTKDGKFEEAKMKKEVEKMLKESFESDLKKMKG